jgi:formamidopyrimidine-DNA glycosylase
MRQEAMFLTFAKSYPAGSGTSLQLSANVSAMPELPEVETFKRYLDSTSLHQRITGLEVRDTYVLKHVSVRELARRLKGRRFESSHLHGKHLFVRTGDQLWLRLHFGMTGSLQYLKRDEQPPKTARVIFRFANKCRLAFDDQRKFGEIGLIDDIDDFLKKRALGPDALDISRSQFRDVLRKHRGPVKSILLNQKLIAGIGNIYADEILFRARIHPATEAGHLSEKNVDEVFRATRYILQNAIEAKADADLMPKSWLLPHRGKGGKCPRCGRELKSSTIGGRTAWFCAHCQKK